MTLARYVSVSRTVKPPRPTCPACKVAMWFDGCYRRKVRQAGVVHELVVHRVRCPRCRAGHAVLPDFVVARRLDTAEVIGTAVAAAAGAPGAACGTALLAGVPARTVRSWRARFTAISMPLAIGFSALAAGRGWQPVDLPCATPAHTAMAAIGAAWHTTLTRDPASPLRGPWRFANAMCGGALMAIRMSVPRARDLGASADPGRPDGGGWPASGSGRNPRRPLVTPIWSHGRAPAPGAADLGFSDTEHCRFINKGCCRTMCRQRGRQHPHGT